VNLLETCSIRCPCCGEPGEILIDCSLPNQSYSEDCQICCRPMAINVSLAADGTPFVVVRSEDD